MLDIGCGTGVYALPLMQAGAAAVTGLDDSAGMLARLHAMAEQHSIAGVKTIKASWKAIDIDGFGLNKAFDIVLASMTPALQTEQDFVNMERCSRRWCVYIGWGAKRENALLSEVFAVHGLEFRAPQGFAAASEVLASLGRKPSLDVWQSSREWKGTVAEAIENLSLQVENHGVKPKPALIESIVASYASLGQVRHSTLIEQGLLVWRVD
ncbi:MAG: Methyltransferase domain protein [Deltaproteobacteria bacterium ADurb.Bin510]|nr:MAG: Methyltransferase domain protein [Deltaproteobacteria bacterium ADurb.Bin510]